MSTSIIKTLLQNEIRALEAKIQFLVDNWPADLEDGCITFPDGNRWDTTATANADQGKRPLRRPDERITKYEDVDLNESYRTGRQKRYTFRNGYGASVVMDTGLIPTKTFFNISKYILIVLALYFMYSGWLELEEVMFGAVNPSNLPVWYCEVRPMVCYH